MAKDLEKKIKEAKNEGELLKVLDFKDGEELTDEELELICGGDNDCSIPANTNDKHVQNSCGQYAVSRCNRP
ncbi:MAG: hypothetical protein KBS34_03045 [Phascolarctobacterium sp.]|nr:hypothetical protein [Candidatus Phascolarctobacterium equi]